MRILMVCLGNICRSPLAEGILKSKTKALGLEWYIDSAGTGKWHVGNLPDPRSIQVALKHGIDIRQQRARQFRESDFKNFDRIFVMDNRNLRTVLKKTYDELPEHKVQLIRNMYLPKQDLEVPDPYRNDDGFEEVYQMLDKACDAIIAAYR